MFDISGIIILLIGAVIGAIIGGLITGLRMQRRYSSELIHSEGELKARDATLYSLKENAEQKGSEITKVRDELTNERQNRVAAETELKNAEENIREQRKLLDDAKKELTDTFNALSAAALKNSSEEFLKLADRVLKTQTIEGKRELEGKKEIIDKSLEAIDKTLSEVKKRIEDVSKGNVEVSTLVKKHEDVTLTLKDTTDHLRQALASSKKRGEWGERMAEDIIRLVGMVEDINYIRNKALEGSPGRPDYTFFLPKNLKINMDVKFPLENYQHYLDAESDQDRKRYKDELLKNTKTMIKQVTTRDYINPIDNTVDYVIVFIPNEQVYSFINEADTTIMDEALKQKVILCSPFTLYAVLAVIRQAVESFNLERTASEILKLLGEFSKQWNLYKERFKGMGEKLDAARTEYDALLTTRSNMLERSLRKIEELRTKEEISLIEDK